MGHPHTSLSVRDILDEYFPDHWIGRGSPTSAAPLPWPPRSPDLTTPHNTLWAIIKEKVAAGRYNTDLRKAVEGAYRTITPKMRRRMSEDMKGHPFVSSIKEHIRIHWTCNQGLRNSKQIMVGYWSVYGEFSPILYNEELHYLYETDLVTTIKVTRSRWARHIVRMQDNLPCKKITSDKPEGRRRAGRPNLGWMKL
jgi:hypothetical protein